MSPFVDRQQALRILINGATGGIGSSLVRKALNEFPNAQIVATGRREQALKALQESCGEHGDRIQTMCFDALSEADLTSLSTNLKERWGSLDVCIHTIGALHGDGLKPEKSLRDLSKDTLVSSYTINTVSFLLLAKHLHKVFRHEKPSIFAAISAKVGSIGDNQLGGWYSYRASKAALNMAVCNVGLEYQRTGCKTVTVAIHPGTTETDLSKPFIGGYPADQLSTPDRTAERLLSMLGKLTPAENGRFLNWDGSPLPW